MSNFSDFAKHLYSDFLLRDLLSFITPGAILLASFMCANFGINRSLEMLTSLHSLIYIALFGFSYLVGLAVQCVGQQVELIFIQLANEPPEIEDPFLRTAQGRKFHWKRNIDFICSKSAHSTADEESHNRERMVVLKQACGNGGLSIVLSSFVLLSSFLLDNCWPGRPASADIFKAITLVSFLILGGSLLYKGNRLHARQQNVIEDIVISKHNDLSSN